MEVLEQRCLLSAAFSIAATKLFGPLSAGTEHSYQTFDSDGGNSIADQTVIGLTNHNGVASLQIDTAITQTSGDTPPMIQTGLITGYTTLIGGIPSTAEEDAINYTTGVTAIVTNSPVQQVLPPVLVLGQTYTFNYAQTTVSTQPGHAPVSTTVNLSDAVTLASDQLKTITVPAGQFDCYEVDTTTTTIVTDGSTSSPSTDKDYYAIGVGAVESDQADGFPEKLIKFVGSQDSLAFQQSGSPTAAGENIKPPVTVKILDKDGSIDSAGPDSTDAVTLTLNGGSTLSGTLTVNAVGGMATFSDLSIKDAGSYTLTAASDSLPGTTTSTAFAISAGQPPELSPTLPRLNVPTSAVGGSKVNINGSVTVANSTASTVTGNATVTAMLVGPNTVNSAVIPFGDSFIATPATVSLQIGKPFKQHVSIKPNKTAALRFHLTSLPNVPIAGSYALEFLVTAPNGSSSMVIGPSITVGPPVITLSETISALKIPSTITIGQKLKAASIKLIVKNSGNVLAKGKTIFSVSASATPGVVGTPIQSTPIVLNTLPGKTKPVTINIKSLPALAAGSYYIVIQATDSLGGTSIVSSGSPITVSA